MTLTATRPRPGLQPAGIDIDGAAASYLRNCKARNLSVETIAIYRWELTRFGGWLTEMGMPTDLGLITRDAIETYILSLTDRLAPASVSMTFQTQR